MSNLKICDTQMTAAIPVIPLSLFRYELCTFLLILLSLLFFIRSASHLCQLPLADPLWRQPYRVPFTTPFAERQMGARAMLPSLVWRDAVPGIPAAATTRAPLTKAQQRWRLNRLLFVSRGWDGNISHHLDFLRGRQPCWNCKLQRETSVVTPKVSLPSPPAV